MKKSTSQNNRTYRPELRVLLDAPEEIKPRLFFEYCKKIISEKNSGEITLEDAGYLIAEPMFIRELDEPLFEEITLLAGRLELPAHISKSDPAVDWKKLVSLVKEYGLKVRSNKLN